MTRITLGHQHRNIVDMKLAQEIRELVLSDRQTFRGFADRPEQPIWSGLSNAINQERQEGACRRARNPQRT
jgi:hypothetical protein